MFDGLYIWDIIVESWEGEGLIARLYAKFCRVYDNALADHKSLHENTTKTDTVAGVGFVYL